MNSLKLTRVCVVGLGTGPEFASILELGRFPNVCHPHDHAPVAPAAVEDWELPYEYAIADSQRLLNERTDSLLASVVRGQDHMNRDRMNEWAQVYMKLSGLGHFANDAPLFEVQL